MCAPPPARGLSSWALDGDWPSLSLSACFKETQPTPRPPCESLGSPNSLLFSLLSDHEGPPHLLACAESYYHFQKNPST